jgi:DNA-binding transcriptional LysR family regulator
MAFDLRSLRYFVAVAEARHFNRAAQQLGMAQPPLSQQIRALEDQLETPLFLRRPRGVELTAAGEALLEDARSLLQQAGQAEARVRRVARGELGQLRLGMINSAPFHPLIPGVIRPASRSASRKAPRPCWRRRCANAAWTRPSSAPCSRPSRASPKPR